MAKRTRAGAASAPIPLSVARARLFELAESVLTGRAGRVALSHKGYDEGLVLMRARDVEKLEAEVAALRGRVAPEPRPLWGMLKSKVPVEDVIAEVRARQNALFAAKMRDIFDDPPSDASPRQPKPAARRRSSRREIAK